MKLLFFMHHLGSFRMYESVVRGLAARGHDVHIVTGRTEDLGWQQALDAMMRESSNVRWSFLDPPADFWIEAGKTIRLWADYLRYFQPDYATTPKLLQRAEERMPPGLVALTKARPVSTPRGRAVLGRVLRAWERALPRVPAIDAFIAAERPDLVLVTPLVYLASVQMEVLRSAVAQGIRTGYCVGSWDHLSSKALLREIPDRVFVWNDTQRDEAIRFHGVDPARVAVTGAQCYDQWFDRVPSRSRDAFCARVGLDPARPYVLYVGSALFHGSPVEARFVREWAERLRASTEPAVRDVQVLLRPHPARREEWESVDFSAIPGVRVYGSNPVDPASKDDYFESLHYSAAVAGLNTSAFLEGAIVGRPAHTILLPEFQENQEGTLHFHYLFTVGGGVLRAGRSWAEHHAQLADSIARAGTPDERSRRFVEAFVRPRGIDRDATGVFVAEVEALATIPVPAPAAQGWRDHARRWLLVAPVLHAARATLGSYVMRTEWSDRRREHLERRARIEREREIARRARAEAREARQRASEAELRRRAERKAAAERERAARLAARETRLEAARREKDAARVRRQQDKARHRRAKRRAQLRARLRARAVGWINRLRPGGDSSRA